MFVYGYNTNEPEQGLPLFVCMGPKSAGFKPECADPDDFAELAERKPHIIYTPSEERPYWWKA